MDRNEVIDLATKYINYLKQNKLEISNAYLFGSYAKGTFKQESDIDLAFFFDSMDDQIEMQIKLMKLRRKFDSRIEPHPFLTRDLNDNNPFIREIISTGIQLKA